GVNPGEDGGYTTSDPFVEESGSTGGSEYDDGKVKITCIEKAYKVNVNPQADDNIDDHVGEEYTYQANFDVENKGTDEDTYSLSAEATTTGWSASAQQSSITVPGESTKSVDVEVIIPSDAGGESSEIRLEAAGEAIDEDSFNLSVDEYYDVDFIAPEDQVEENSGSKDYQFTVQNEGNVEDTYSLSVEDSEGWSPSVPTEMTVQPQDQKSEKVTVNIPEDAGGLTDDITITASSQNSDVQQSGSFTVKLEKNLETDVKAPSDQAVKEAKNYTFYYEVENLGNAQDTYDLYVDGGDWAVEIDGSEEISVDVGETKEVGVKVDVPPDAGGMTNTVVLKAESQSDGSVNDSGSMDVTLEAVNSFSVNVDDVSAGEEPYIEILNAVHQDGTSVQGEREVEISIGGETIIEVLNFNSGETGYRWGVITEAGSYTAEVKIDETTESDDFKVEASKASEISVVSQPEDTEAGENITGPPEVLVEDTYGNGVEGVNVTVTVSGEADLLNVTKSTNNSGIATFDALVIEKNGTYQLEFEAEDVKEKALSEGFEITPSDPHYLEVSPEETTITTEESVNYTAVAYDEYDNKIGNVTSDTNWSIEEEAGGDWDQENGTYYPGDAGNWTVTGEYEGLTQDVTLNVEPIEYELDIDVDGEGTTSPGPGTHTYVDGKEVTVKAIENNESWRFVGWSGDIESGNIKANITMTSDKEVTAHFEMKTYNITVVTVGDGSVTVEPDKESYVHGDVVNLTAFPREGHEFIEWSGDYNGTEEGIELTMDEDKSITAHFEIKTYTLNITVEGEGSVDLDPEKAEYEHGEKVNLTATPNESYEFVEWTGDLVGSEKDVGVNVTEDKNITARFLQEANFKIEIIDYGDEIKVDEETSVEYRVNNTGELGGEQEIIFTVYNGSEKVYEEKTNVVLDEGEISDEKEFNWTSEEPGDYTVKIRSEDEDVSADVTVQEEISEEDIKVKRLDIYPEEPKKDDEIKVRVELVNDGNASGEYLAEIVIGGQLEDTEIVEVEQGETENVTFTHVFEEAGEYDVEVGEETTSVDVGTGETETFPMKFVFVGIGLLLVLVIPILLYIRMRRSSNKERRDAHNQRRIGGSPRASGKTAPSSSGQNDTDWRGEKTPSPPDNPSSRDVKSSDTGEVQNFDSSINSTSAVKDVFKSLGKTTKDQAYQTLVEEKGRVMDQQEFKEEIEKLVKDEKLTIQPRRGSTDIYLWNE
ncbi:MAG: InlB B-repeat-containing protein, partial [Thermoplasmata archaeon]